jgi:acyl-CoA thioesterase FadM
MPISPIYSKPLIIPKNVIDETDPVNNAAYVQGRQDNALEHNSSIGGIQAKGPASTQVVHEDRVEYLLRAFAEDAIEIKTRVENIRRVRSLRKYEFGRKSDLKILVKGETDRAFEDTATGGPLASPQNVIDGFNSPMSKLQNN